MASTKEQPSPSERRKQLHEIMRQVIIAGKQSFALGLKQRLGDPTVSKPDRLQEAIDNGTFKTSTTD